MNKIIYLDNAATTPLSENAFNAISLFSRELFYNPSSNGIKSVIVKNKIEETREKIAKMINAKNNKSIVFTSGATESNNIAILSGTRRKGEFVFSSGEHPSVFQCAKNLQQNSSIVYYCCLLPTGELDVNDLEKLLNPNTQFLSTIFISNETGAISDLQMVKTLKNKICPQAIWHVDAVQAFGKIDVDVEKIGCDFMSFSSHKIHGPKGLGILYAKNPNKISKLFLGGEQENNLRAGTENVSAIAGLCEVLPSKNQIAENYEIVKTLKKDFLNVISNNLNIAENCLNSSPYICSLSVNGVLGATLQRQLDSQEIIIGTGSACASKKVGNRILESMGFDRQKVLSSVRISFSSLLTTKEVVFAAESFCKAVKQLRQFGEK